MLRIDDVFEAVMRRRLRRERLGVALLLRMTAMQRIGYREPVSPLCFFLGFPAMRTGTAMRDRRCGAILGMLLAASVFMGRPVRSTHRHVNVLVRFQTAHCLLTGSTGPVRLRLTCA